jgi:hypothetical protein
MSFFSLFLSLEGRQKRRVGKKGKQNKESEGQEMRRHPLQNQNLVCSSSSMLIDKPRDMSQTSSR